MPVRRAARHAGGLYKRVFRAVGRPLRKVEAEAEHLHEIERVGDSAETPFIAILGVLLFLLPIVAVVLGASFAAYYL